MAAQSFERGHRESTAQDPDSTVLKGDRTPHRAASASGRAETRWTAMASARPGEGGGAEAPEAAARLAGVHRERTMRLVNIEHHFLPRVRALYRLAMTKPSASLLSDLYR